MMRLVAHSDASVVEHKGDECEYDQYQRRYLRQHTSAYVSIRPHLSAYVRIRQHTSAYVRIRQNKTNASTTSISGDTSLKMCGSSGEKRRRMVCDKCAGSEVFSPTAPAWTHSAVLRYTLRYFQVSARCNRRLMRSNQREY